MLTFDDKGDGGVKKPQKPAYVIHGCSLTKQKMVNIKDTQFYVKNFKVERKKNRKKFDIPERESEPQIWIFTKGESDEIKSRQGS